MRKPIKKIIAMVIATTTILGVSVTGASANEWKNDNGSWWYSEGNSWAIGWREIDGKWYYFNQGGYLEHNITIDGCELGSNGAWVVTTPKTSTNVTSNVNNSSANTSIKKYQMTVFFEKSTGNIHACADGIQSYGALDGLANPEELAKVYGMIVVEKDREISYNFEKYKVVGDKIVKR